MDGFLMICLVVVGLVVLLDQGRKREQAVKYLVSKYRDQFNLPVISNVERPELPTIDNELFDLAMSGMVNKSHLLRYAWFTLLGFFLGWVGAALYIVYLMPNPFLR